MPISESQRKAVRKYNDKAYDRLEIKVAKGKKDDIKASAEAMGESLNGYVVQAIDERMERDKAVNAFTVQPPQDKDGVK